jgi:hypothetical protein
MKRKALAALTLSLLVFATDAGAESKKEYQNRFRIMLDFAVRTNEYIRGRLMDKKLAGYAQVMAEKNATQAERMTPPKQYSGLHPHFLLVLENIERSFFFAEKGQLANYRHHQKIVRKELQILEALAEREHLDLYIWDRGH